MKLSTAFRIPLSYICFARTLILMACYCTTGMATTVSKDSPSEGINLVTFLEGKPQQHDAIYTGAIQILESMKTSPSCNRMAASELVMSCQSLGDKSGDTPDSGTYVTLERVRSFYAARLAICELNGAGASVPRLCIPVTVSGPPGKRMFSIPSRSKPPLSPVDKESAALLEGCLKTLESRPQWWTSYSNNRQNAVVICQAARIEGEKEELLELYRSIVESSSKLNDGLQDALRAATAQSSQYRTFMDVTEAMQMRMHHEMRETESHFKSFLAKIFQGIEVSAQSAIIALTSALENFQTGALTFEKNVQNISREADGLQYIIRAIHDEVLARHDELETARRQDAQSHKDIVTAIHSELESILQNEVVKISHGLGAFDASLEWLAAKLENVMQQELSISERLRNFETSLEESRLRAEDLQTMQVRQFNTTKAQLKLQDSLHMQLQISYALLGQTAAAAANLQAMIDEAAARYKGFSGLAGLPWQYSTWIACGMFFIYAIIQCPTFTVALLALGTAPFIIWKSI
ncbi:putative nuclear membrane fusion protein Kar5 [Aspergillus candidus]|uniref:Putative nuclear membrane fusion protein Kar5 n=1 Tax=Aspergillus candidus TaxID=41067 RepID=A0A2I2FG73_ASPCN|nr:putative nuclear membrane fusion protein Kar5 [Aspergillus candidus]PLB39627.1 putative nuclear membrane fusion protein Kar5 [Aspergillus candidus]